MSKKKIIIIVIISLIFLSLPVIIVAIYRNGKSKEIKRKEEETLKLAELKTKEYLKKEYNKDFKIEYNSNGFKSNEFSIDGSSFECGHDKNIIEYVFSVYADDLDEPFYVTVWMNKETREIEVKEVNGDYDNNESTSYKIIKQYEEEKVEIKEDLYNIVSNNYKDFSIDDKSNSDTILVTTNEYYYEEYNKDTIGKIIELLKDKKLEIKIIFKDINKNYNKYSNIEEEQEFINFYHDVYYYSKENIIDNYQIEVLTNSIKIKFNTNIKGNYSEYYENIYSELKEICIKYKKYLNVSFSDDTILISKYEENKTLKELLHE